MYLLCSAAEDAPSHHRASALHCLKSRRYPAQHHYMPSWARWAQKPGLPAQFCWPDPAAQSTCKWGMGRWRTYIHARHGGTADSAAQGSTTICQVGTLGKNTRTACLVLSPNSGTCRLTQSHHKTMPGVGIRGRLYSAQAGHTPSLESDTDVRVA